MSLRHALPPAALAIAVLAALPAAVQAQQRGFTARDMAAMPRYSAPALSPDGNRVAYVVRSVDLPANTTSTAVWVRGHADNEWNNRCDALAVAEREKLA